MKLTRQILPLLISVIALAIAIWGILGKNKDKIGYVNIKQVFQEFDMKKELEANLEANLKLKKKALDSLGFELQTKTTLLNQEKPSQELINHYQQLQQIYYNEKQAFDQYNMETTATFNKQIIDQMTQYIKDFGAKKEYTYILGLNEDGSILYGQEKQDISASVITFINNSYQGKID